MSANIDSTANTDGIKNGGDIGAMTTVVNTNAAESQDPMVNGIWMAIIKVLSTV